MPILLAVPVADTSLHQCYMCFAQLRPLVQEASAKASKFDKCHNIAF